MLGYPSWRRRRHFYSQLNQTRLFARLSIYAFIGVIALILGTTFLFIFYSRDLPNPDTIIQKGDISTKIYDRSGKLLYDVFQQSRRTPVKLSDIPLSLRQATIAIEDKNFYTNQGFDPVGILRAVFDIIFRHQLVGGSTLTQQLVKNVLLTSQQTIVRKIKEFVLAVEIGRKFSKDQILQMYLNDVSYGGTAVGVEEAAQTYFGKNVSDLDLVQSAILAGLPQAPTALSPFGPSPIAYQARTRDVLRRMREDGYITPDQEKMADSQLTQVTFATESAQLKAPHFVFYVLDLLTQRYGAATVQSGGLSVTTTLDSNLQEQAQSIVSDEISKVLSLHITNGAAMVSDPKTGEILAMVGSRRWDDPDYDGKVNVVLSPRQPGSAIKPVTYVTGFKQGYTPATMLMDVSTSFPGGIGQPDYQPVNYDGKFHGPLSIRNALGSSINIPAVKMLALVGIKNMLSTAYDMGLTTLAPTDANLKRLGLSVTLGGGEVRLVDLVSAYSAFANGGLRQNPISILKVTDKDGNVLEQFHSSPGPRVLTSGQAYLIDNILSDNTARLITFSPTSYLNIPGRNVAVKTGTTNDKRDNWTIGWTPSFIAGVWVGNNDNTPMTQVASGVTGASPIWRRIILAALTDTKNEVFPVPPDVDTAEVDQVSGYRAHDSFTSKLEYFIRGTEPTGDDPIHQMVKVCRSSGKLATPADIAHGVFDNKEFFFFKEKDPTAGPKNPNRWQQGIDSWLSSQSDSRYHPPTDYCDTASDVVINIQTPSDQQQINSNNFDIKATAQSVGNITTMEILVDGQSKATSNHETISASVNEPDGTHSVTVKASDDQSHSAQVSINIGVKVPWNWSNATPTPSPIPSPTSTPNPTVTPTATP